MNFPTLIRRSLRFHWRSHLGVVLGATIGSAVLIGALIVGDSVKGSLRERALDRIGSAQIALFSGEQTFRSELAQGLAPWTMTYSNELSAAGLPATNILPVVPVLLLRGTAYTPDGTARANQIQVLGVDEQFWRLAPRPPSFPAISNGSVILNKPLAAHLRITTGEEILLRVVKSSRLSGDMPAAPKAGNPITLRLRIQAIIADDEFGVFALQAGSSAPLNAFVSLPELQQHTFETNRANLLLMSAVQKLVRRSGFPMRDFVQTLLRENGSSKTAAKITLYRAAPVVAEQAQASLKNLLVEVWRLADAGLELNILDYPAAVELAAQSVFINPVVESRIMGREVTESRVTERDEFARRMTFATNTHPIFTYLANLLTVGTNGTPYSMVTAAGAPWTPPGLRDDEIVINQWLANDLHAQPGDALALIYFDPESGARLTERTNLFHVHSIVPMQIPWADRTLMPQFHGIEKAATTAEWDTAFPLVHKIRPQDDDYWRDHRGTPKAFITLAAGQKLWANRFGNLTAIRFPIPPNPVAQACQPAGSDGIPVTSSEHQAGIPGEPVSNDDRATSAAGTFRAALEKKILATFKPEELGLRFESVREQALKAAEQSQDFGELFIGFSLFVIVAALLLIAMLFQFSLEQRAPEIGTLLALGFTPKQVRRLLLGEGAAVAFIGGLIGAVGGIGYARAMLHGLATVWRDAVGTSTLHFFVTPQSLVIGLFASTIMAVLTIWLAMRKQARRPARELLADTLECGDLPPPSSVGDLSPVAARQGAPQKNCARSQHSKMGLLAFAAALGLIGWAVTKGDTANAGIFFGAGALMLIAGLSFLSARLTRRSSPSSIRHPPSWQTLALRGLVRRRSRSLATVALIASSVFLIVSIGVFRLNANRNATQRSSGTGGFALIGESTMPVVADLNTQAGRESFALNEADFTGVNIVPFRVRAGDDASCLNLNRAQRPRLLGVNARLLEGRFTSAKGVAWPSLDRGQRNESLTEYSETSQRLFTSSPTMTNEVPAIGDAASIQWAMGKQIGDTLDYVDERGQSFKIRIVGAVANSILQGSLVIDEAEFVKRFPSQSGYQHFLIDAPTNRVVGVSAKLSRALQDVGLELTPAPQRLAQFNAVQNTYLGTFQLLGGLGLLLGSAGLGIVVLRNVLERRSELAVLLAVGWRQADVRQLVLAEHIALLGLGLALGISAAAVAVLPSVLTPGAELPWLTLGLTLTAVLANGVAWAWLATRFGLHGDLLATLRNE